MNGIGQYMPHIIGNDELKAGLCRDISSNSLSHAYIFEGHTGSGRRTLALLCAAASACEKKHDTSAPIPCMECVSCKKILERKSPDVIFINREDKATIGVDATRFLKEDVHVIPNDLEHKFYIIEEADKMTHQAQNALLLTLEEPPSFVHFFLIANDATTLLETIRSRAPTLRTEPISDKQIDEYISNHDRRAAQMKISSPNEYHDLIKASDMSIGKALSLLDPKAWNSIYELRLYVKSFVNAAVNKRGSKDILSLLTVLWGKREIINERLPLILNAVRDLILIKKSEDASLCFYSNRDEAIELCDKVSMSFLYSLQEAIANALAENQRNSSVKLLTTKMALSASLI